MSKSLAREVGLLRQIVTHLERLSLPLGGLTQELLLKEGLGRVGRTAHGAIAIRLPGRPAFDKLVDCLLDLVPAMQRGAIYEDIKIELFNWIESFVGRDPSTVERDDAIALVAYFEKWFSGRAAPRRVFVPCVISRTPAERFEIGPVTFEFIDALSTSDFYLYSSGDPALGRRGFDDLVQWMREGGGDWLARVSVNGCEQKRAEQIAEFAVDLVIVALQLVAPNYETRSMARLDARRGMSEKRTLSEANGFESASWTRNEPGLVIGPGTLHHLLKTYLHIFAAVGNVVRSFASGSFRLPTLERAWCDAAYWFYQALAESLDTIAIAKLETALEVLLRSESSSGSKRRILKILQAFFNLEPDDPIQPEAYLNAEDFAQKVVADRSKILHGTWSTLNPRGIDRAGMEDFVASVLRKAVLELEAYSHSIDPADDIDEFLRWVGQRKTTPISK